MKIAIVHDSLSEFGGAERVLIALLKLFPNSHLFTAFANKSVLTEYFSHIEKTNIHVLFSAANFWARHTSLFQMFAPRVWRSISLDEFDLVITSSGYLMSNLVVAPNPQCVHYVHSIPKNIFSLEPKTTLQSASGYDRGIKKIYTKAMQRSSYVLTNSLHMKKILHTSLDVVSKCIYPPVNISYVRRDYIESQKRKKRDYFLIISRLDRSKSIELAIEACNLLKEKLIIIGTSNESAYERYLRRIAGPTITFLGFQSDDALERYYAHAKGFIFTPWSEDFGIAPVEAMAHGIPVIAYYGGGVKETVIEGKTGIFFHRHNSNSIIEALKYFQHRRWNASFIVAHAAQFDERVFKREFRQYISRAMRQ